MARRAPDKPGMGVVFVAGVQGARQAKAAKAAGLIRTKTLASLRVEGPDRKGAGAKMTAALAEAGVNLRGLSAAAVGGKFIAFLALDSTAVASKALRVLRKV
jgi:predicted amino acid-binding ACT domain protein